jgi:hypothetical protein
MTYKQLIYGNTPIPSQSEATVIAEMQRYYKSKGKGDHIVAYFNNNPENLTKEFPLCLRETYESIYMRYRNYKPKGVRKCDILEDRESLIFPKYSIVDCLDMPVLRGHRKIYKMFVAEDAHRFIIFVNFHKKKAFPYCGGYGHVLFSSKQGDRID